MATTDSEAIDFAYTVASEQLSRQLARLDLLDTKLAAVIGALAAFAALFAASTKGHLIVGVLLFPIAAAVNGYLARSYDAPPNPAGLITYVNAGKTAMQEQALAAILDALALNGPKAQRKATWLNFALALTIVAVAVTMVIAYRFPAKP